MEFGDRTWARAPISLLLLPIADAATINLIFTTSVSSIKKMLSGELDEEEEEEMEEEEELTEYEEIEEGTRTKQRLTGLETPDVIDLRKVQRKEADDQAEMRLYKVLEEKEVSIGPEFVNHSQMLYVLALQLQVDLLKNQRPERVDVTLHPEELEVMDDVLPAKYEQAREEERFGKQQDYFSDMVAENASKMERKLDKYWWSLQPKGGRVNKKKIVYVLLIQGPEPLRNCSFGGFMLAIL
ncbi:splicing factor 3B subunit 2 [Hordeum vulgare]|nr:splicing factor 3B subunit 2 [Hordeum vulgare]